MILQRGMFWLMVPSIPFIYVGGMMLLTVVVILGQLVGDRYRHKLPGKDKIRDIS